MLSSCAIYFFFFNDTATTEIYTLSLHDALPIAADADVAPDGGTGRWHDGNLDWTGASDAIRFRVRGRITRLRAYELWSRVTGGPVRRLSEAGSPPIVTRAEWG